MDDPQEVTPAEAHARPSQVADHLKLSTAMLRRHVASYEKVFGSLPASKRDGRLYSREVVDRLEAALGLYHTGRVVSVEDGLRRIAAGDESIAETLEEIQQPEPLTLLLEELRRLREATERQNALLAAQGERMDRLEAENRAAREDLKALQPPQQLETVSKRRVWWRWWS